MHRAATFGALVMIAVQVSGKATRDAIFLSHFDVTQLPVMIMGAVTLFHAVAPSF